MQLLSVALPVAAAACLVWLASNCSGVSGVIIGVCAGLLLAASQQESAGMLALGVVVRALVKRVNALTGTTTEGNTAGAASGPFDLQHLLLNIDPLMLPAWCNLGWWSPQMQQLRANPATQLSYPLACSELVRQLASAAGMNSDSTVLDVGCGCGEQDFFLARTVRPQRIVAVNLAAQQIEWAQKRMQALDEADKAQQRQAHKAPRSEPVTALSDSISFHVGSATSLDALLLDHGDASFSHVLAVDCAYHFSPSRLPFFASAHAALQEGGTLALVDILPRLPPTSAAAAAMCGGATLPWRWRWGLWAISKACAVPEANLVSAQRYEGQLRQAGFQGRDVQVRDISEQAGMFEGFAAFVEQRCSGGDAAAALAWPLRGAWFRPALWLRYRVTAAALRYIGRHRLAQLVMVTATKSKGTQQEAASRMTS